jgi:GLPGLI family protein
MNTIVKILVIALIFITSNVMAQDFQGVATYKSHRQMNIQMDSTQVNSEMQERMMAMMKKQFEKTYLLTFNKEESLYKEDEQLEAPQMSGMQMVMVDTGGSDILFKNTKDETYTNQNEVFGKVFLIEDKLEKRDWVLSNETKNIGEYTCYKATMTREQPVERGFIRINDESSGSDEEEEETEPEMEEITVTAWYAPEIPVNNGPGQYQGLPGLILEVNDGSLTLMCSKIVLNPKDQVSISKPSKGKKVNQEKFDKIMEKKMQEMNERYNSDRRDGHNVEIRIGG